MKLLREDAKVGHARREAVPVASSAELTSDAGHRVGQVPRVELVVGDVEETLPSFIEANPQLMIALVYVDLCLYRPTKAALEAIWPLMPKGSVMAFDQLAFPEFPGETRAALEVIGADALDLRRFNFESQVSYLVR